MATLVSSTATGDITSTGRAQIGGQGFQGYYAYWKNNQAYNVDFAVRSIGGGGVWWASACYNHSGNTYGCGREVWYTAYSGSFSAESVQHNYGNSQGGNLGFSNPGSTTLRCTKNAGFYPGYGGCIIQVNGPI